MDLPEIAAEPGVRRARALIESRDEATVEEQLRLAAIPAPTGGEAERGTYLRGRFEEIGLRDLEVDAVGNVLGWLPGAAAAGRGGAPIVLAAHLDTVFPSGTDVTPRREGARLRAPGITDNARGLAAMLALAAALRAAELVTARPVLFVGTVGEEGSGDLRGVKHLFRPRSPLRRAAAFIALDGAGLSRVVHRAIGATRLRVAMRGPGGHSWGDRGTPNPAHALGLAIANLRGILPSVAEGCAVTVGRLGGGTSVNAIPAEAWLELDLRSERGDVLASLEREARQGLTRAVEEESGGQRGGRPLTLSVQRIGERPCGETPADAPLVEAALEATRLVGGAPELAASSTDANVPIALGIPALALGAGGRAGGIHTTGEWYENRGGSRGIERGLLTLLAVAGVERG